MTRKTTLFTLAEKKMARQKITALTAYDAPMATRIDSAGIDILLVGDSVGNVVLGLDSTLQVDIADLLHHTKAVSRAKRNSMIVADLPFGSGHVSIADTCKNALLLVQQGRAEAIKMELFHSQNIDHVRAVINMGIPVMGHIGFTPQFLHQMGGYKVQGRNPEAADRLLSLAHRLEDAGAFAIVLEMIPATLAKTITTALKIPTIGIGAGPHCDGQVLVINDLLGLSESTPKFVRRYADLGTPIQDAIQAYKLDVESGSFPGAEESFE
jgi:3-methyl-2-oxobutanoate hydroxymethyltransferase